MGLGQVPVQRDPQGLQSKARQLRAGVSELLSPPGEP